MLPNFDEFVFSVYNKTSTEKKALERLFCQ